MVATDRPRALLVRISPQSFQSSVTAATVSIELVPEWIFLVVVLVIRLGGVENVGLGYLGDDRLGSTMTASFVTPAIFRENYEFETDRCGTRMAGVTNDAVIVDPIPVGATPQALTKCGNKRGIYKYQVDIICLFTTSYKKIWRREWDSNPR